MEVNKIICGDNVKVLKTLPDNCIDLTVTSPPYDLIRDGAYNSIFDFEGLVKQLYRVTKIGGVIVWVVADQTIKGGESGTSFRQALYFQEQGFLIHDTMIYMKNSCAFPSSNRYYQVWEYMFVFSKGKPKTVNLIKDRENKWKTPWGQTTKRAKDGSLVPTKMSKTYNDFGVRWNVWLYNIGAGFSQKKNSLAYSHPATFPVKLAEDHIKSWSNEGEDIILDPFAGSGTSGIAAQQLGRNFIMIEINKTYCELVQKRFKTECDIDVEVDNFGQ